MLRVQIPYHLPQHKKKIVWISKFDAIPDNFSWMALPLIEFIPKQLFSDYPDCSHLQ